MKTSFPASRDARGSTAFSLNYLSGSEAGKELVLAEGQEYILGRGRKVQICVDDEKASRQHGRIFYRNGELVLEDLDSANGTFVNGERVETITLSDGDHILIGRAGFKVVARIKVSPKAQDWWDQTQVTIDTVTAAPAKPGMTEHWLSGSLKSVALVDLLQLLSNSQKSAVVILKNKDDQARVYLRDGQVVFASLNDRTAPQPVKTLHRVLRWKTGRFEMAPLGEVPDGPRITEPTQSLLLDGAQLADELIGLEDKLPGANTRLALAEPLPKRLRDLTPRELDMVQLVLEHKSWLDVMDHYEGTDLEASLHLVELL